MEHKTEGIKTGRPEDFHNFDIYTLIFDMFLNKQTQFQTEQNHANCLIQNMFRVGTARPTEKKQTQSKPILRGPNTKKNYEKLRLTDSSNPL